MGSLICSEDVIGAIQEHITLCWGDAEYISTYESLS
jgi:hypothetical protein